jgi:hypothetical protein
MSNGVDLVIKVEPAEPTVSQMQLNFLGKNQHPDHQFRVYRGPTSL